MSNRDVVGKVSGTVKRLKDPEFQGWHFMTALESDSMFWVYQSPDNLKAALVSGYSGEVLLIIDRVSGMKLYQNPNMQKEAKGYTLKKIARTLI